MRGEGTRGMRDIMSTRVMRDMRGKEYEGEGTRGMRDMMSTRGMRYMMGKGYERY